MCKTQRNHSKYLPINSSECHFFDEIVNNFVFQIDAYRIKTNIYIKVVNRIINHFFCIVILFIEVSKWIVSGVSNFSSMYKTYKLLDIFSLFSKIFKEITGTGKVNIFI